MEDLKLKLKNLIDRDVDVIPVHLNGKKGFMPEYFDFTARNSASRFFSETEEGALINLLQYLEEKQPGGKNGTDSQS